MADEENSKEFAANLGFAIIAWQGIERACAFLYIALINAKFSHAAMGAFYSIRGFNQRVEMLEVAARHRLSLASAEHLKDDFSELMGRVKQASSIRNRMAHSTVEEEKTATGSRFRMSPDIFDFSKADFADPEKWHEALKKKSLSQDDVFGAFDAFHKLSADINAFAGRVKELPTS